MAVFSERADRAKQFMPFDALKGLREAFEEKEKVVVEKIELSEYAKDELDRKIKLIKKNDIITVVYYCDGEYLKVTGMVVRIDETCRVLQVVNRRIGFGDVYEIGREGEM